MSKRFLSLSESVSRLDRELRRVKMQGMKEFGLKSSHTLVLYLLYTQPEGCSFAQLAEGSSSDAGLLSRTLHELRDLHLIEKNGEDGKYKQIYVLSEQGKDYGASISRRIEEAEQLVRQDLDEQDLETFYKVAAQISKNLSELPDQWRNTHGR